MTVLHTSRLTLRPFTEDDAPAHAALYADSDVTRFLPGGPFSPDAVAARSARSRARFTEHWAEHGWGVWAVIDRATGDLIGHCGLNHMPESTDIEVLYALARSAWGRGLATEAAEAALAHGFGPLRLPRIIAVTKPENSASRRVMERLGMTYEGERDAFSMHVACYAISREGWRAARAEVEP